MPRVSPLKKGSMDGFGRQNYLFLPMPKLLSEVQVFNMQKKVLLVNPWIYDFAAFDLWTKPIGLLYIGGLLREKGYKVSMINCLDRYHPELVKIYYPKSNEYGCGKFYKEIIKKPLILENVPRKYGRYGLPLQIFRNELQNIEKPDIILVTSVMTYWYPGVFEIIKELRNKFTDVPIVLGGIYATLCYDHAKEKSGADYVVKGEGEIQALKLVESLIGKASYEDWIPGDINEYPYPAYDLLTNKDALAILTSRGCPMGCTYCASRLVAGKFRQRDPIKVVDEVEFYIKNYHTRNFAFYDDALLINTEKHISVILDEVIQRKLECQFHTPNGMHARFIDVTLARKMKEAGFKTIRISLETSDPIRQKSTGDKVSSEDLRSAVENLKEAGYTGKDIGVYVLIGLPGQPLEEMIESVRYVHECGALVKLAVYSPIPNTEEWERAVAQNMIDPKADPLLHNDSIYPIRISGLDIKYIHQVKALALQYNSVLS